MLPSMKCYRKNGSDQRDGWEHVKLPAPSMKCYRKNGSDPTLGSIGGDPSVTPQ